MIKPSKLLSFDLETGGDPQEFALQPFRYAKQPTHNEAWINSDAIAWLDGRRIKTRSRKYPTREQHHQLLTHAIKTGKWIVGWNISFDAAWLVAEGLGADVEQCRFLDAMLLYQHLYREPEYEIPSAKKRSWSLKAAVREFIPSAGGYEDDVTYNPQTEEEWANLLHYNEKDVEYTLFLTIKFLRMLNEQSPQQLRNALIEAAAIGPVAHTYVNGLDVDVAATEQLDGHLSEIIDTSGAKLEREGVTDKVLASPKQLTTKLYEDWQLPILVTTPKGSPSTDKVALYKLSAIDERASAIKEYRENKGNRTKFVHKIKDSVAYNGDGKTRPAMRIYGTYTGRATFASKQGRNKDERQTGFAIHQMKNATEFRRQIVAPPGYTMIEWDAAGQEFRWMAVESDDDTMLSLCMPGEDPHSYMGAGVGQVDYHWLMANHEENKEAKNMRKMGKVGNLSCQFRIGWRKLHTQAHVQFGMPVTEHEAQHIHNTYHATYPGVKQYWKRKIAEARRKGYAETLAGRRVILNGNWTSKQDGWKLESTAVNFPIQGIGADQKYLAIKMIQPLLRKYGGYMIFELHDGLYAIFPDHVAMEAGLKVRDVLTNMPYKKAWGFQPPVPLPWDMKIGPNWGDLKPVEA